MPRRRLTAYTIMYIAGISAGYFFTERQRPAEAAGLAAAAAFAALFARTGSGRERERYLLTAVMLAGILSFSLRYHSYEASVMRALEDDSGYASISGTIRSVSVKDDEVSVIVRCLTDSGRRLPVQIRLPGSADLAGLEPYELSGASARCRGSFREIAAPDNPGCFDYKTYMRTKGVCLSFAAESFEITGIDNGALTGLRRRLYREREDFISRFDDESGGFIRGVIFGDKSDIDEEVKREFSMNSTGHILAVSGLHVGFLYALLRVLTGRRRTGAVSAVIIAVLVMYGEMTCWSAATARACSVLGISLLALHLRRPFDLLSSVSLAAVLLLIRQPYQLFDAGFQMSFLAMSGIAFLSRPLSMLLGEAGGAMIAVQLGTLPAAACTFYRMNPLAVFINIPVILLSSVLVPLCLLLMCFSAVTGLAAPQAGIDLAELISFAVTGINHILSFDGGFSQKIAGFGAGTAALAYFAMFGMASEWTRIRLIRRQYKEIASLALMMLMPLAMLSACLSDSLADDEIVFVAVGQGDCVHVRTKDCSVLIDGGGREDFNTGERILMPYLLHSGADRIEMALVTHLHMDHYKGICELSSIYPVGAAGIPADYRPYSGGNGEDGMSLPAESIRYVGPDSVIRMSDDVYIEVLWPAEISDEPVAADDPNEHNSVYMVHYGDVKLMVTGDLLEADELSMVEHYRGSDALKCDILKVAHHGSRSSSSEAFLDAASPDIAVIQVGRNNLYGHPHPQTLERLEERGIRVLRTDIHGAVGIDIRGKGYAVDMFKEKPH